MPASCGPIRVVVDDREKDPRVQEALRRSPGVEVEVKRLFAGDFLVGNRLLVERKSIRDLGASITSGRLFSQARMIAGSQYPGVVLLEGAASDLQRCGLSRRAIQGALVSLTVAFGIPVLRASDPSESAQLIIIAGRQIARAGRAAAPRRNRRPKLKRNIQLEILRGLPRIGRGRAEKLLDVFETIGAIAYASTYDLEQVDGLGTKTAGAIYWALHESQARYGPNRLKTPTSGGIHES